MKGEYIGLLTRSMKGKSMGRTVSLASMTMFIMFLVFAGEYSAFGATTSGMQPTPAEGNNSTKVWCDDDDVCTLDYEDGEGGCIHEPIDCNDYNPSTIDTCDPWTGCINTPINCDDNNACTIDTSDGMGGCIHNPLDCNDGNPSTIDTCDTVTGCINTPINCDDNNACTRDVFFPWIGACGYISIDCSDSDACTIDTCDPQTGCNHEWVNCDDDNACTMDYCESDTGCVHEPIDCNDYNPSTIDTCDPLSGACINTPLCDDNSVCTIDTTDGMGGCLHTPIDCNDGDPDTQDLCDPAIGCFHTIPPRITDVSPSQGLISGGIEITINGTDFVADGTTQVLFDETPATNVQVYLGGYISYYITCVLPAHSPGTVDVTVINPDGGRDTRAAAFTYVKNHPADLDNDLKIRMGEAIVYLSGWQGGANPMAYAIRAAYLWQNGEGYHYDAAEAPPMCWALGDSEINIGLPGGVPLDLVRIPAGSFQMGSPDTERDRWGDEGPVHTVTIDYDFYMGKYEVTQAQWLAVMGSSPGDYTWDSGQGDSYPAYFVSWDDAQAFITALNTHITNTGQGPATVRLPSEAEWEYACRAGTQTRFYFDDSLNVGDGCEDDGVRSQYMWYCGNSSDEGGPGYGSKPVGGKLENAFGLHDMSGNVLEWCQDCYHSSYTGAPVDGSAWELPTGSYRVSRGGSWLYDAGYCRSAFRYSDWPDARNDLIGFRLVM